jgi:hypothetical protein
LENDRIESDHAALKKLITPMSDFKSLSSAKATLRRIEAIHTIKQCHVHGKQTGSQQKSILWKTCLDWLPDRHPPKGKLCLYQINAIDPPYGLLTAIIAELM